MITLKYPELVKQIIVEDDELALSHLSDSYGYSEDYLRKALKRGSVSEDVFKFLNEDVLNNIGSINNKRCLQARLREIRKAK